MAYNANSSETFSNDSPQVHQGEESAEEGYVELMSTETEDLLKEMRLAYQNRTRRPRPKPNRNKNQPAAVQNDYEDESEEIGYDDSDDDDSDTEDGYDDPNDADYCNLSPKGKPNRRSTRCRDARLLPTGEIVQDESSDAETNENAATGVASTPFTGMRKRVSAGGKTTKRNMMPGTRSWDYFMWSDDEFNDEQPAKRRKTYKLPHEIESLLGQANVSFAQGRNEEALKMVEEVVRLHPGYYESYDVLSVFHGMQGDKPKQLHFGLLSAHLDRNCRAEKWAELAELATETGETDHAIRCYTKAHRGKPTRWEFYEPKLALLEKMLDSLNESGRMSREGILKQIADTKLAAVKGVMQNTEQVSTDEYVAFVKKVFQQFYDSNDIRRAISCLKCILERIQSGGGDIVYAYLNDLVHLAMHAKDYEDALLAVFRYSDLQAYNSSSPVKLREDQFSERIEPHRRERPLTGKEGGSITITHYVVPEGFPVDLMAKTIACWLRLKRYEPAQPLLDMMTSEVTVLVAPEAYWEIAEALADGLWYGEAEKLLEQLTLTPECEGSAAVWLCHAEVLSAQGKLESASVAFARVVQLSPYHVSARLSLSALQQQLGQTEEALQTLDIGDGRLVPLETLDERLLYQRCVLLRQQESWNQFITTARYLMAMHFKDAYSPNAWVIASGMKWDKWKLGQLFRSAVLDAVRNTNWERLVQRMAPIETSTAHADDVWDIFFRMCELMHERRMATDLFYVLCYASQCPIFLRGGRLRTVLTLLLLVALSKRQAKVAWAILRHCAPIEDNNVLWNAFGLLFSVSQEIRYHKFTLRAMMRMPESLALAWLSGNNSLIAGTYQHALAEYFYILQRRPDDPLLNLVIGLNFVHLAVRKFTARRHDLFIQGMAFLSKYEELRGPCQEVYYNIGRAFHQAGVLYAAIHYYRKALTLPPPTLTTCRSDTLEAHRGVGESMYDLRPAIAHNLALIYQNSENTLMARDLLERYCTVE